MRRLLVVVALGALILVGMPKKSEAGFTTSLTLGGNYSLQLSNTTEFERVGLNIEGTIGWRIPFLTVDLGVHYDFLKQNFQLRPGLRVHLGWFYLRAAIPLAFDFKFNPNDLFNMGVLFGTGFEFKIKKFSILVEANISPFFMRIDVTDKGGGLWLPVELRLGVGYNF